jgi:glycosyltransferase involved in cell wall biosynthesis
LLKQGYAVSPYEYKSKIKYKYPLEFIKQLFFILRNIKKADYYICHFAGYSSFLPALLGKLFKIPCFIIVAGTDASKIPEINYGNFNKRIYGWFTSISLQLAKHILPVHRSLVYQKYGYFKGGMPAQGYTVFAPKTINVPFKEIPYGYDSELFKPDLSIERVSNTFLTIGILSESNVYYRKGIDLIIELAKKRPELSFTIIGGTKNKLIDIPENVKTYPFLKSKELIKLLSAHEFYFQLSIMEGFPNALAEAMLCGCIPIGSNVSGIPDIIGDCGYILENKDLNLLSSIVDMAINNENKKENSSFSRKRIVENYTNEIRFEKLSSCLLNAT